MKAMENIGKGIGQVASNLVAGRYHYLDYLINKRRMEKPGKLNQDWAGGLKDIYITVVESQKESSMGGKNKVLKIPRACQ